MNFERNIFIYWETPMDEAPIIVKISYEKLQIATQRDGWELHLVTKDNIKNYLPDFNRFQDVVSRGHRKTVHQRSDILRIYLIEEHGGIWLDFSAILFQSLDWLSNDDLFDHLIINKIGTNTDDPDMLMLGQGFHQSPYSYYNNNNRLVSEEYFGHAIHFIAAKRKTPIMTAWKDKFDDLVTQSYEDMMPRLIEKRIFVKNIYQWDVYLSGNVAFETVIQQKQQQLDDEIKLSNLFSKRKNVYEHFKIWQVHGQVGPIMIGRFERFHIAHLFGRTRQEVEQKLGKLWFYIKINHHWRGEVLGRQQLAQEYFRERPHKTIVNIIRRGPTVEECKLFLIVKGSILHNLYENSKYINEIKTPIITIEQRDMMRRYCSQINPDMYALHHEPQWPPIGEVTKALRQIQFSNMTSFKQRISLIPTFYKDQLNQLRGKWYQACGALLLYLIVRNLYILVNIVFTSIKRRIITKQQCQSAILLETLESYMSISFLKAKIHQSLTRENLLPLLKWAILSGLGLALLYGKAFAYAITYQFLQEIEWKGYMGLWTKMALVLSYNVILDWVISKLINHKYVNTLVSMETLLKETRVVLYLPLGYIGVLHMYVIFGFAHHHTMNFAAGGLLLYVWLEEIKERKVGFSLLYTIESILSKTKWAFMGLFLVYRLSRNLRYIRINDHYAKEYLADILNGGFWILFYGLAAIGLVYFVKKLFLIECTKAEREIQTEAERESRVLKKANTYHCFFMLTIIWLVVSKMSEIYDSKMFSPYTFDFSSHFRVYIGLYTLCATLIRLRFNQKFPSIHGILLAFCLLAPILYWFSGQTFRDWLDWRPHIKQICQTLMIIMFVIVEQFKQAQIEQVKNKEHQLFQGSEEIITQRKLCQENQIQEENPRNLLDAKNKSKFVDNISMIV